MFRPAWTGNYAAFGVRTGGSSSENMSTAVANVEFNPGTKCIIHNINLNWANSTSIDHNSGNHAINTIYGIK